MGFSDLPINGLLYMVGVFILIIAYTLLNEAEEFTVHDNLRLVLWGLLILCTLINYIPVNVIDLRQPHRILAIALIFPVAYFMVRDLILPVKKAIVPRKGPNSKLFTMNPTALKITQALNKSSVMRELTLFVILRWLILFGIYTAGLYLTWSKLL